jgi:hypothetical protein
VAVGGGDGSAVAGDVEPAQALIRSAMAKNNTMRLLGREGVPVTFDLLNAAKRFKYFQS